MGYSSFIFMGPLGHSNSAALLVSITRLAQSFKESSCVHLGFLSEIWINLGCWPSIKPGLSGGRYFHQFLVEQKDAVRYAYRNFLRSIILG